MRSLALSLASAAALIACSGDDTNPAVPDAGSADATVDAAPDSGHDAAIVPTVAGLRVAHWSADAPPVAFCVAAHGTGAFAPLLPEGDAGLDGGAEDLAFLNVSSYVFVAPGSYDVRAVVGGASDCATPVAPDLTSPPALAAGAMATMALVGEAHPSDGTIPGLSLAWFLDDLAPAGAVGVRAVNAAPSLPSADFGTGTLEKSFSPLFDAIPFGTASAPRDGGAPDASPAIDSHGYATSSALSNATLSAHAPDGTADSAIATAVFAASGSVITFVLVGGSGEDAGAQILECVDNAGTVGGLSSCALTTP